MNRNKNERTCRMDLRVSPKEKEQIKALADSCKISTSEYLRKRALGYAVKAAPPDAFYHFIRQMSRLLNQVPSAKVEEEALKLFDEVRAILSEGPKYKIEYFLGNFRHFVALSSGKQILFEPLVSTVSICSKNDCGMRCGRKNTPRTRHFARRVCCWWYVNSEPAKSQVFSTVKN